MKIEEELKKFVVTKFGGDVQRDSDGCTQVMNAIRVLNRAIVVLSAPGKRFKGDSKLTDMSIEMSKFILKQQNWEIEWNLIKNRFLDLMYWLGLTDMYPLLETVKESIEANPYYDFVVSRPEFIQANIMYEFLKRNGLVVTLVDAADILFLTADGRLDEEKTKNALAGKIPEIGYLIMEGFYGTTPDGKIKTLGRNGSDVTQAMISSILPEEVTPVAVNWKRGVNGILNANPKFVPDAQTVSRMTYNHSRILSVGGSPVLHKDTAAYYKRRGIEINVRNIENPEHPGTHVISSLEKGENVIAIAELEDLTYFQVPRMMSQPEVGFEARIFKIFDEENISRSQTFPRTDCCPFLVETKRLIDVDSDESPDEKVRLLDERIQGLSGKIIESVSPDEIIVMKDMALITIIGSQGVYGRIIYSLDVRHIHYYLADYSPDESFILVKNADLERALKVIHNEFFL